MSAQGFANQVVEAHAAVRALDWVGALRAALAAWQLAPHEQLAEAIEAIGPRAAASVPRLEGETFKQRNKAWYAAARRRDPVERHYLLATLTDVRGDVELLARLQKLEPDLDPRTAQRLVALIEDPNAWRRTHECHEQLFAHLVRAGDTRVLARAKQWVDGALPDFGGARLRELVAALEAEYGGIESTAPVAALDALLAACGTSMTEALAAVREQELLAAIYADPADDVPRLVYADWLQTRDDPRGEFIALQLNPRAEGVWRRTSELEAIYGERWLGSLAPYVSKTSHGFSRGFLTRCHLERTGPGGVVQRAPDDPAWATVEESSFVLPPLASAHGLCVALGLDDVELAYLATFADPPRIERMSIAGWDSDYDGRTGTWNAASRAAVMAFATCKLPALRVLELVGTRAWDGQDGMTPERLIWPWREAGVAELKTPTNLVHLAAWHAAIADAPALMRLSLVSRGGFATDDAWRATFTRDAGGAFTCLEVESGRGSERVGALQETTELAAGLAALPANALTRLTITLPRLDDLAGTPQLTAVTAAVACQTRLATRSITHRGRPAR